MSFLRYPAYKDSGVAWLGEVPEHWDVFPVKNVAKIVNGYPFDSKQFDPSEGYPLVRIRDLDCTSAETYFNGEFLEQAAITSDDVLIGMDGDFNIGRWRGEGVALLNQRMCCVRGEGEVISRLLEYALRIPLKAINEITYATTVKHLSSSDVEKTRVALPRDAVEQQTIAAFLDRETAKIDALVAEQEKLIALLKEKRQAVISHAVTKGLDPNVPMKDSGIEWLGEVPAHWDVMPIKYVCSLLKDGTHLPPPRVDSGIPLLSVRNIQDGIFGLLDDDSMISEQHYLELCRAFVPQLGDVLLAIVGATLGKTAIVPSGIGQFHIQRSLAIFRTNILMHNKLLNRLFESGNFQQLLWENVGFSAQPGIYLGPLANFRIPVPPREEQEILIGSLGETARFDVLTTEAERAIDLLKERRTALISAAVTGKIDVRGLAWTH